MELPLQLVVPRPPGRLDGITQRPTMQVIQKVPVVGRSHSKLEFAHRTPFRATACAAPGVNPTAPPEHDCVARQARPQNSPPHPQTADKNCRRIPAPSACDHVRPADRPHSRTVRRSHRRRPEDSGGRGPRPCPVITADPRPPHQFVSPARGSHRRRPTRTAAAKRCRSSVTRRDLRVVVIGARPIRRVVDPGGKHARWATPIPDSTRVRSRRVATSPSADHTNP